MRKIRDIFVMEDGPGLYKPKRKMILADVEDEIVAMKRLWPPGSGVHKRRQAEANLLRTGLEVW